MQRKKPTNAKPAEEPVVSRKDTLRKKVKLKQDETLKSNMLSSSSVTLLRL